MDTTTPAPASARPRRSARLATAVVGTSLALSALAPGATPAGAAPPGPVEILSAIGVDQPGPAGIHRIDWTAPSGGAIDTVEVEQWDAGLTTELTSWEQDVDEYEPTRFTGPLPDGTTHQYRVRAHGPDGWGPFGDFVPATLTAGATHIQPYDDAVEFVSRQAVDFAGDVTATEQETWPAKLQSSEDVVDFVDHFAVRNERKHRPAVIRLYRAAFDRVPDADGLEYWDDRLELGTTTLRKVSAFFVASAEFEATYGGLGNEEFVALVYENVLDRAPDQAGLAYWTGRLDQGTTTKGDLLLGFSESPEGKALVHGRVTVIDVWTTVMGEPPSEGSIDRYSGHIDLGGTGGDIAVMLFATGGYPQP